MVDARGQIGQLARGNNVYNGGMPNAQSGPGMNMGPPAGNDNAQMDPNVMLKRQMDQAKSALQMANMQTQRRTQEEGLKAAMQRRMGGGPSAQGLKASKGKAGGAAALLKRKNDVSAAASRVRNAYTSG